MLANAVRQGDLRFPQVIFDDFERADSSDLGFTSVGHVPWQKVTGSWEIKGDRLFVPTATTNPLTVVNARRANVEVETDAAPDAS